MTNHTTITKPAGGDALLQLITRYRCELDAFNANQFEDDDECIAAANSTFESTLSNMVGMPAETKAEALAALQLLQHELEDLSLAAGQLATNLTSLFAAVRGYIEKQQ
jgi:hypothetical protein